MLIENGVLRVRAGLNPVVLTIPLGASSRRGVFAKDGELESVALYARTFPTDDARREWLRIDVAPRAWIAATALAHAIGRTDARGTSTVAANDRAALKDLYLSLRIYKNATNFEAALSVAWLPTGPGQCLVIGPAGAAERRVRHLAQRNPVEEALVLDPHRLVLASAEYLDGSPPWDSFLGAASARLGLVPAPEGPLVILAERAPRRAGDTGTTVAIDFGTHETSVVTQREGQRDVTVQGPLAPWYFHVVDVTLHGATWHATFVAPPRSFEERTTVGNPVMPGALIERWSVLARRPIPGRRDADQGIPSVLIPQAAQPEGLLGHPFETLGDQIIGARALGLVDLAMHADREEELRGDDAPRPPEDPTTQVEVDDLEPAPKLQLGRNPQHALEFLDGVFDELAAKEIVRGADGGIDAVGPILLSYPVAFLAQDRETLERIAREALLQGGLKGLCADPPEAPITFLDEATAAALGVLYHRFGSLRLDRVLDAFAPVSIDPATSPPRSVRILTFDCGGGTTDLVLLRLHEDGDRIVSTIEDFYGLPFAGLEITRRLAKEIKRKLRGNLPREQQEKLRTRFAHADDPRGASRTREERIRQRRTLGFYHLAESAKIALAAPTALDDASLRRSLTQRAQQYLPEFEVARVLDALPARAWLEECTATVLAPALETAERWLARADAPVQLLLASGRSSQLPGVGERLRLACVKAPRPVQAQHCVSPRDLAGSEHGFGVLDLHAAQRGAARPDLSKFGVAIGLAHGYVLTTKTGEGRRLVVQPIDEHKRTRYLGVLRQEGRGVQFVMPEDRLVVRADGRPVDPAAVLWIDEQPFAVRAVLGQNFRGPPRPGAAGSVDPPIPFAQVRFTPTSLIERERLGIKRVQVGFTQRTASDLTLAALRVERNGAWEEVRAEAEGAASLTVGGLTAHFEAWRLEFDFRRNGVIDPEDLDRE
jgi:hypothetical protein